MIDHSTWQTLIVTIVDKGALAALLALLAILLTRSLERFKTNLAWSAELLKQRMAVARELVTDFKALDEAHLQISLIHIYSRGADNSFVGPRDTFLAHLQVAQLLFPSKVVLALEEIQGAYEAWLSDIKPACTPSELDERTESGELDLSRLTPDELSWHKHQRKKLKDAIATSLESMQSSFPREVSL